MAFIRLTFTPPEHPDDHDVVGHVERAGLPVRGPSGRIYVLHADGIVTQHPTSSQATFAALARPGSELLLWLVPSPDGQGAAVAAELHREELRLGVRLDLAGASAEEQETTARAVDALLMRLVDVELEAELG